MPGSRYQHGLDILTELREVVPCRPPDDLEVDVEVSVRQPIAHRADLIPFEVLSCCRRVKGSYRNSFGAIRRDGRQGLPMVSCLASATAQCTINQFTKRDIRF